MYNHNQMNLVGKIHTPLGHTAGKVHFLHRMDMVIDWQSLVKIAVSLEPGGPKKIRQSRMAYLKMVKTLFLQHFYNLSDPMLEELIDDRLSFQEFVGWGMNDNDPDLKAYWKFKEELADSNLTGRIFEEINVQLYANGLFIRKGSIVNASVLELAGRPDFKENKESAPMRPVRQYKSGDHPANGKPYINMSNGRLTHTGYKGYNRHDSINGHGSTNSHEIYIGHNNNIGNNGQNGVNARTGLDADRNWIGGSPFVIPEIEQENEIEEQILYDTKIPGNISGKELLREKVYADAPLNVLLADDDEDDRFIFKEAIEELKINTTVKMVKDGRQLMDYLLKKDTVLPHLIFLDLNMPCINGMDCLKEIKSNSKLKDICVAIYSTSTSDKDLEASFLYGANIYIHKPSEFNTIKEVLQKAVTGAFIYRDPPFNKANFMLRI